MSEIYEFGSFRLDPRERTLTFHSNPIRLRPKVFDTLCVLVACHGKLVTKDELMTLVWPETVVEENNLALSITVLRKTFREVDPEGKWIETVTGKGYRFLGAVRFAGGSSKLGPQGPEQFSRLPGPKLLQRDPELGALRASLNSALQGQRQFVCITGEAGIGKTELLHAFLAGLPSNDGALLLGTGQCVEHSGEGEAYMPVLEALGRICRGTNGTSVVDLLSRHAPSWLVQMPSLVEPAVFSSLQERILGVTRDRMLRELAEAVEAIAERFPVVMALEDLHWADPSTLELISALARRQQPARFLLIGTNRARDAGESGRALESLTEELHLRGQCNVIRPSLLSEDAIAQIILTQRPDSEGTAQLAATIRERTSGNPLFAHALVDYWSSQGAGSELPRGVPGNLAAMIQRKLEGLQEPEEELLECASVAGVKFSPVIVAMVLGRDAEEVEGQCAELASRGTLLRPCSLTEWPDDEVSSWFTFGHSLYQQVLYERIPPSRKARLHRRVGERLERTFGPSAADRAGELAHHFLAGRDPERALVHLQAAAEAALRKSAPREAAVHLRRGLQLLKTLPETRDHQTREFTLLAMLAPTAIAIEGFAAPDAENGFGRACEIGERLGDSERVSQVILGRAFMHELRGEYYLTEELLGQHLEQAVPQQSPTVAVHADSLMACSLFHQGKFAGALQRAEHALQIYHAGRDREFLAPYGENPSVACQAWAALSLWFLGFPDRAARQVDHLVAFSEAPDHGFTLSTATMYAAHVHQLRRDGACAAQWSERTLRLAQAQGYLYNVSFAKVVKGWADVESGNSEIGLALIREGLAIAESIGAKLDRPYLLALCAEAQLACGRPAAAFADLKEALSLVRASRAFFYEAELYRLRAAATLRSGAVNAESEAEADLKTALDVARPQGAKSLELRAATDLSALLRKQNRVPAARQILAAPYRLFSEGFQTRDLQEAGTLLDQLG